MTTQLIFMIFLYVTCKNKEEGNAIARALIQARAAACVNIHPISSVWRDNDTNSLRKTNEAVLFVKTTPEKMFEARNIIRRVGSYATPCIAEIPVSRVNEDYKKWFDAAL